MGKRRGHRIGYEISGIYINLNSFTNVLRSFISFCLFSAWIQYVCHAEVNAILNKNSADVAGCSVR